MVVVTQSYINKWRKWRALTASKLPLISSIRPAKNKKMDPWEETQHQECLRTLRIMRTIKKKKQKKKHWAEFWQTLGYFLRYGCSSFSASSTSPSPVPAKTKNGNKTSSLCLSLRLQLHVWVFFFFFFAYLVWNSWRCDNRAAACYIGKTWTCFLQSPPEAAEGQTPAWTHTHTISEHINVFLRNIVYRETTEAGNTFWYILFKFSLCWRSSICLSTRVL